MTSTPNDVNQGICFPAPSFKQLFDIYQIVEDHQVVGIVDGGERRIAPIISGTFSGERLRGVVLPGGSDWLLERADGAWCIDIRLVLQTTDDHLIAMTYQGIRHGSPEIMQKLKDRQVVDPNSYYYRALVRFETSAEPYHWLNRIAAIAVGHRFPSGPAYRVYEIG